MLEAHSTLFSYVRTLVLYLEFVRPDDSDEASESEIHHAISRILDHLRSVSTLIIVFSRSYANGERDEEWATWNRISPSCRDVLTHAINASLDALYIQGIRDIPVRIILPLPHLRLILLEKHSGFTTGGHVDDSDANDALTPRALQWLSLHRTALVYFPPLLPSFCDVPHLSMEIAGMQEHLAAWTILEALPRLESLVLNYSNRISSARRNFDLSEWYSGVGLLMHWMLTVAVQYRTASWKRRNRDAHCRPSHTFATLQLSSMLNTTPLARATLCLFLYHGCSQP